ncbi:hypothetical protein [Ruania rhizosphaerae]|uniref:hypothetical protein n=1 Tax=Ruania rhizosphaerae TaxID=1840413 RepID=UPI001F3D173C|nr:hypothetical protein [Ruania rhizosphaerae]
MANALERIADHLEGTRPAPPPPPAPKPEGVTREELQRTVQKLLNDGQKQAVREAIRNLGGGVTTLAAVPDARLDDLATALMPEIARYGRRRRLANRTRAKEGES